MRSPVSLWPLDELLLDDGDGSTDKDISGVGSVVSVKDVGSVELLGAGLLEQATRVSRASANKSTSIDFIFDHSPF
jgi:hypothetical protein